VSASPWAPSLPDSKRASIAAESLTSAAPHASPSRRRDRCSVRGRRVTPQLSFSCRIVVARPLGPPCVAPRDPPGPFGCPPSASTASRREPSVQAGRHLEELRATRVARTSRNDAARTGKEDSP
jgi:hypothetical protein